MLSQACAHPIKTLRFFVRSFGLASITHSRSRSLTIIHIVEKQQSKKEEK